MKGEPPSDGSLYWTGATDFSTARATTATDPIIKVRTHVSLGQLCYVNEVNRCPADGRVSELAPPAVPKQSRVVLKFFLYTGDRALCCSSGDF